jgi:hypothetical protein
MSRPRHRTPPRVRGLLVTVLLAVGAWLAVAAAGTGAPALGSKRFAPNGDGFGTVKPRRVFNGDDASGLVYHIRCDDWGSAVARGRGLHPIFKPGGGYYRKPSHSRLKAYDLGHCGHRHRPAYRRLKFRDQRRPGSPLGKWYLWSGARNLCKAFAA